MIDPVEYGRVLERLDAQDRLILEMRADLKELVALANRGRGAWWVALTIVAGISSVLSWGVSHFFR